MTKTRLNCPKAKYLQGHNSKEKAKLFISDDFHTQSSAKRIVLQHEQNPLEFPLKRQKSLNEDTKCLKRRNHTCQLQLSAVQCSKTVKQTLRLTKEFLIKLYTSLCTYSVCLADIWDPVMSSCNVYILLTIMQVFPGDSETMTSSLSAHTCFLRKLLPPSCF